MVEPVEATIIESLVVEAARFLVPLKQLEKPDGVHVLLRELGWKFPEADSLGNGNQSVVARINTLVDNLGKLFDKGPDGDCISEIEELTQSVESTIDVLTKEDGLRGELAIALGKYRDFSIESGILSEECPRRLIDYLVLSYLKTYRPAYYSFGWLLGLFEADEVEAKHPWEPEPSYVVLRVRWPRFAELLSNPATFLELYGWGSEEGLSPSFWLSRLELVLRCLRIPGGLYTQDSLVHMVLNPDSAESRESRIPLCQGGIWPDTYMEAGLNIAPLDARVAPVSKPKGIAIVPYLLGAATIGDATGENWEWALEGTAGLESGMGLLLRPPGDLEIATSLFTDPASAMESTEGRVELSILRRAEGLEPNVIFGSVGGSRLSVAGVGARFLAGVSSGDSELAAELDMDGLAVVIDLSEGDGFLQAILSGQKIENAFDLTIGVSNKDGLYFRGSGGCEVTIPIHKKVGPVSIGSAFVSLQITRDIDIVLAVSLGVELGPISAHFDRVGIRVPVRIPEDCRGNLGPLDFPGVKFVSPSGAGLSINASGFVGGGFLDFDNDNKRYAGIVQLSAGDLELVGIGLITTQMPDGSDGFSLLINIGVEFSPPIQLPYGFTLSGVGGLIALNRTMEVDVLRAGLRTGTLNSILFPEDPIANAARIVSDLRSVFPPVNDRVVVGPMVKLGWGSPTIIQADIGIFIELPDPVRIALLGQITVALPQEHNAVIELHIDVLGVIDFEAETLSIDATIYDSRIYQYVLTGDAAARFSWGDSPSLALSLGGFHPRFSPPAGFPALRRLTLNLSQGRNLQLYCSAYQAITSNTVQFGATVVLFARKRGATLEGTLSFDTLIYMSPFSFVVDISGNVAARYRGRRLASVLLRMRLSGPTPWNARGRAEFAILWWDVTVRFNETWGPREQLEIEPIDAWPLLKDALERDESWGARLPTGVSAVEALASQEGEGEALLVHPMGSLEVRQNVLPLEIELQKIGGAPLVGESYFSIDRVTVVNEDTEDSSESEESELQFEVADVEEDFALAQFLMLSDDERLTLPSFDKMKAGVSLDAGHIDFGPAIDSSGLEYETILIREDRTTCAIELEDRAEKEPMAETMELKRQLQASAAVRCQLRTTGRRKYAVAGKQKAVKLLEDRFQVVDMGDSMEPVPDLKRDRTRGRLQTEQAMLAYLKTNPELSGRLRVVPTGGLAR